MWRAPKVDPKQAAERMRHLLRTSTHARRWPPLSSIQAIWSMYAVSPTRPARRAQKPFAAKSKRALAFGADYLVLHPGS